MSIYKKFLKEEIGKLQKEPLGKQLKRESLLTFSTLWHGNVLLMRTGLLQNSVHMITQTLVEVKSY